MLATCISEGAVPGRRGTDIGFCEGRGENTRLAEFRGTTGKEVVAEDAFNAPLDGDGISVKLAFPTILVSLTEAFRVAGRASFMSSSEEYSELDGESRRL